MKKHIAEIVEKEYDANDVVSITIVSNKFANKLDVVVEKRERIGGCRSERDPYNRG